MKTSKEKYYEKEKQKQQICKKLNDFENKHNYWKKYEKPNIQLPNWMRIKEK